MIINNLFNVESKVVLITGGSRGIGEMIATGFISNGAKGLLKKGIVFPGGFGV